MYRARLSAKAINSKLRILTIAVVGLMAALFVATFTGSAANPSSGTLSIANPSLTYSTGPNVQSNPSAQSGAAGAGLICNAALPCDDYALTINVPAAYENTHNAVITVQWPTPAEDYDVYILDNNGDVIKDAASSSDPEIAIINAKPGAYTIRVVPFAVAGGTFTATIDLVAKPTSTTPLPPGPGTPRFQNYAAPGSMGNSAGEPSLGVGLPVAGHPDGRTMFIAGLETLRVTWDDCSSPAKPLWEDKSFATTSLVTLDPILYTDFATGRTLVSQLGPKTSFLAYTNNDGGEDADTTNDYLQSQGSGINSGVDHQTIGGGPFRPGLPDGIGYANAVYYASQDAAVAQMALSRDGGQTFGPAVPMYNLTQCGGLHGHIKVAPDGTVYLPNKGCGGTQGVVVSEDEGITFTVRPVPGSSPGDTDPSIAVDASGKVYFAFSDGDGHAKVAVSSNKGVTWSTPIDVGSTFGIQNSVFPAAVGGSANRAAVMFLATETGGNYQAMGTFAGVWHIYSSHTFDGGATWTTVRVSPDNDPVQRGSICTSGTTCGADRNLLDFNDMQVDHEGRAMIGYADGCLGCTSPTGADSRAAKATIARQSGGRRLFAAFDPNPAEPALPAAPRVNSVAKDANGVVHIEWSAPDNGGAPITGYNIYRKVGAGGTYTLLASVAEDKTTYDDATAAPNVQYFYKVTAVNSVGEGTNCGDFPIGTAAPVESPCALPGVTLVEDPAGDNTTTAAQRDIRTVSVAEVYDPNVSANKLFFTIKVGNLDPIPPPESRWTVFFTRNNPAPATGSTEWFVTMSTETDETATNGGQPVFRYGHVTVNPTTGTRTLNTDGTLDSGSQSPDGTIRLVISTPTRTNTGATGLDFPALQTGETLGNVNATTQQVLVAVLLNDDSTGAATYTLVGNAFCRPNTAPIARLTATPTSGPEPFIVNFDASASSDADTDAPADTIASYTFNFGDESPEVTQASPTVSHTYTEDGVYRATVRVTDSRGKASTNPAEAIITVEPAGAGALTNYALASRGSVATASSTYTSRNYKTINAIDGSNSGVGWELGGGWNDNTRGVWPDHLSVTFGGGAKTISEVRVYTLQNSFNAPVTPDENTDASLYGIRDFQVQVFNSATGQFETVAGGAITNNTKALRKITLGSPVSTTAVRVLVTAGREHFSRIVELEAYGAAGQ